MGRFCLLIILGAVLGGCGDPGEPTKGAGSIHPSGWGAEGGHARALRASGDDLSRCYACHAPDRGPGACDDCHKSAGGPEACDTCHAKLPAPHEAHARYDCATCHKVPAAPGTPGHTADLGHRDVRFAGLATDDRHRPTYTIEGTCADTRCHAGPGAAKPAPAWSDQERVACGDCHGTPPPGHPNDRCDRCHGAVVAADGRITAPERHADGHVDVVDRRHEGCDACHGSNGDPMPPRDLAGNTEHTARGVGAHLAHRRPADAAPVACETCHRVPLHVGDPGHLDDDTPGADLTFSARAGAATYDRVAGACANTACHGADRPSWTGDAPCGSCHGLPPEGHPEGDCARCHLTAKPGGGIADPSAHVDGEVDVRALGSEACGRCHADGGRVPPGGSHPAHAGFACATCHPVPERPYTPGHMDGRVEITLATGTFREGRCADAPCHGSRSTPTWGRPETVPGCGSCHGNPPEGHSDMPCANCHPGGAAHANGRVDFAFPDNCGGCHLAEPESGAHRAHRAGTEAAVIPCTTCHHVPDRVDAPGHLGPPPADVALTTGVYQDGTCTNTACHAEAGAANPAPRWDQGPEASRCGACHGVPPPDHWVWPCAQCHSSVIDADNHIIAPERHVNGRVDFR